MEPQERVRSDATELRDWSQDRSACCCLISTACF